MYISQHHLEYCLDRARVIAEQYALQHIGGADTRRCVDKLLLTCRAYVGKPVELRKVDIDKERTTIWGAFLNLGNSYVVSYADNLSGSWQRYVIAKELFHIVLDHPDYWNMDLAAHIEEVMFCFPKEDSQPGPATVSEIMAEMAAMEFLFPYKRRMTEVAGPDKANFLVLAERYDLPQPQIQAYMSAPFMQALKPFFKPD